MLRYRAHHLLFSREERRIFGIASEYLSTRPFALLIRAAAPELIARLCFAVETIKFRARAREQAYTYNFT